MRILVTRPQPAADKTAARLRALGHEPLVLPLTQSIPEPELALAALRRTGYTMLALTSAQAAQTLALLAGDIASYFDIPVFCVGPATANAAAQLGFRSIITGPGTGERLAAQIASNIADNDSHHVLYLAGTPRSPGFEAVLRRETIKFDSVEIYRMVPLDDAEPRLQSILLDKPPEIVLLYSRETAQRFLELPSAGAMAGLRYLCLSDTIADALRPTIQNVAVAAAPDEDSLLRLL